MPLQNIIRVFLASPGDVDAERIAVGEAIDEINLSSGRSLGARYELIKWETHSRPGFGEDAQDVINRQIADGYEVFIGVMWARFGSPTGRAESGTAEEFERAIARWSRDNRSVQIMLYFKDAPISPSKIDIRQWEKVVAFQERVSSQLGGLYRKFESTEEFKNLVRVHLSTLLNELVSGTEALSTSTPAAIDDASAALRNFFAVQDEEDDEGAEEISERGTLALERVGQIATDIAGAIERLGDKISKKTEEISRLTSSGIPMTPAVAKSQADAVAKHIEEFVSELLKLIPEFREQHGIATEGFTALVVLSNSLPRRPETEMRHALNSLSSMRSTMMESAAKVSQLQATMADMPRATSAFNRSKKRSSAILADLSEQIIEAAESTLGVEQLIEAALNKDSRIS